MRNLNLIHHSKHFLNVVNIKKFIEHPENPIFYLASSSELYAFDSTNNLLKTLFEVPEIVDIEYLVISNEICIATAAGEVLTYNLDTRTHEVKTCCDGIERMAFSPDQSVSVFVTQSMNVVTLNYDFDPLTEHCLNDTQFGDSEFITVGWGKKETQFHGSEGKEAARRKEEVKAIDNLDEIDKRCYITWRGDGEYFAVSFVQNQERRRMFKVFNKEGNLQFSSEPCSALEPPIFWRPSGNWIAVPQVVVGNKYQITLFEKNGLRHRELVLPFKRQDQFVKSISWNSDSEILLIETYHVTNDKQCSLYLYTICNYHWYLKQHYQFSTPIAAYIWSINGKLLHILLDNGTIESLKWEFVVNHSMGFNAEDEAMVAVIDGTNILLTNFRGTIIPPPMSGYQLALENPVSQVGFLSRQEDEKNMNNFFVVDSVTGSVIIFESKFAFNDKDMIPVQRINGAQFLKKYEVSDGTRCNRFLWVTPTIFVCLQEGKFILLEANDGKLELTDSFSLDNKVVAMQSYGKVIYFQNSSGQIHKVEINSSNKFCMNEHLFDLPEVCDKLEIAQNANNKMPAQIYALKHRYNLYCNASKLASDVTSFHLTDKYVSFTSLTQLYFIKLADDTQSKQAIIENRRMERGSKIVTIVPKSSKCVFQLPRGNLEVIHPRILSINLIGDMLDSCKYWSAFDLLRKQRINVNLIVDHNPKKFLDELEDFVKQIKNPQWLNLFITDLQNQDISISMYGSNYDAAQQQIKYPNSYEIGQKVEKICNNLIAVFEKHVGDGDYDLPKITCYVKKGLVESALAHIWQLKKSEVGQQTVSRPKAEEALKYLLYLVDVNQLFNVALGMYDFGLVLYVATKSQKDPKEYLPFLNELKKYEDNYQKYKIDVFLKRYIKAIAHISLCGEDKFVEALELIKSQNLYIAGMQFYKQLSDCYQKVCAAYGDYLRINGKLLEASLMYEKAGDYQQALASARNVLAWRKCLGLCKKKGCSDDEMKDFGMKLVVGLQEASRFEDAVQLLQICRPTDHFAIMNAALKGKLYRDALFHATFADADSLDTVVVPHFIKYSEALLNELKEDDQSFSHYKNRLQIVRKERLAKNNDSGDHGEDHEKYDDNCDLYSDTTSMGSSRYTNSSKNTGKTFRSSKNRRKHERKLLNLKEGNQFEDIAIIDALHTLITKCFSLQQQHHFKDILEAAIEMNELEMGKTLQSHYERFLKTIKGSLDEIWLPEMIVSGQLQSETTPTDYVQVQNEQHYAMIKPHQRYKPDLQILEWKFHILEC